MKKEMRTVCYDEELQIEAYHFEGIMQPFPNHFHDYYVIGFIEAGTRCLSCKNKNYTVTSGDILLFELNDSHSCMQCDGGTLDYRGLNITKETMLFLVSELIGLYGQPFEKCMPECREEIELACEFMEKHFEEPVALEDLCAYSNLSKSTLLRAFTKSKGVTPYRYLQAIRIDKAKKLLEEGVSLMDAGLRTGRQEICSCEGFMSLRPPAVLSRRGKCRFPV